MGPVADELRPPVDPDRDHWRGGEHAAVTLVEYGNYQCLYSRLAFRAIQRLERQLGDQLRFVFRHFPLTRIHPHALAAAHLAEAAALQGCFWPMHELLFGHQQALEDADLWGYADQLGLDRQRLAADLDSHRVWQRGPGRRRQRPRKRHPRHPDAVHQRTAAPWRLRPGHPGRGVGRREREAMTMAVCIHLSQLTLAFVAATGGMDVRLISAQALKKKLDRGDRLKLINALGAWEYRAAHIPGSLHFATPEEALRALNRNDEIVVHCSNPSCGASVALYQLLERNGYRNVRRFAGGLQEWQQAGYPLEGTMVDAQGDAPGPEPRRGDAGER